ncbi:hypothetical protein GBAR_LOCUS23357 [Geodia barretti]|uniref:Uncharacterized protein n=1 Tax=Geodia barretti TaxID=519541 RepID=A0AA35T772_GEOBA|nr:hypothetical protein GBAR_LOCUS23357 [Geodia barretti]
MRAEDCPNRGVDDSLCFSGAEIPDMPPKVIRTSRSLKNTDIGIDISVPGHEPASSPKVVKRYHVLVLPLCHTLRRLHKVKVQLCSLR